MDRPTDRPTGRRLLSRIDLSSQLKLTKREKISHIFGCWRKKDNFKLKLWIVKLWLHSYLMKEKQSKISLCQSLNLAKWQSNWLEHTNQPTQRPPPPETFKALPGNPESRFCCASLKAQLKILSNLNSSSDLVRLFVVRSFCALQKKMLVPILGQGTQRAPKA